MRRRKVLSRSVRNVVEKLESRTLLSSTISLGTGTASYAGIVYSDTNNNGVQDAGEAAIAGASVTLQQVGTIATPTVQTDASGAFSFTQMATGEYTVSVAGINGLIQDNPGFHHVSLVAGLSATDTIGMNANPTNVSNTDISGTVFYDPNQTGVFTAGVDTPLIGDRVYADLNGNGIFDAGEPNTTSNNVGQFTLSVDPGITLLRVVPRSGFNQDAPGYVLVNANTGVPVAADLGESNLVAISGTVFLDTNGNGIQDPGELGVAGENVAAAGNLGGGNNTLTDSSGHYQLTGLAPDTYTLSVQSTNGYLEDAPGSVSFTIGAGQTQTVNVGEGLPASISGTVFDDKNSNGVQDAGDAGLAQQQVFIDANNNGVFDTGEVSGTTDANGNYTLPNLGPGTYLVRLSFPNGAIPTGPVNPSHSYTLTLGSGVDLTNQSFGFQTADLSAKILKIPTKPLVAGTVTQKATVVVTNVGSRRAIGLVGINMYAQPNGVVLDTATAAQIGKFDQIAINLLPGKSKKYVVTINYPTTIVTGPYFDFAQINSNAQDNNAANDVSPAVGPISITQPFIDLAASYQTQPVFVTYPGHGTQLSVLVTNNGNFTTDGILDFRVYLTQVPQLEPTDIALYNYRFPALHIKPHKSKVLHFVLPNPGPQYGSRFIILSLDSGDPIGEANLQNNLVVPAAPTRFD